MAKLLYVEPGDEITDLVDRIRRAGEDRDLVFVVPPDGRVLRSVLDMRLLMQYTRGFQKRIAIVSGDPLIQGLAIRTGFPTFASLARLEQGAALRAVPEGAAAGAATAAALAGGATATTVDSQEAAAPAVAPPAAPGTALTPKGPSELWAGGGVAARGFWGRLRGMWSSQMGRQRLIALSALGVVVVLILLVFLLPSATITLGVGAHRLVDSATIEGTDGPVSGNTLDEITTEALQSKTFNQSFTITPSGTQSLPPVPASGTMQFCASRSGPGNPPFTLTFNGSPSFVASSSVVFTTSSSSSGGTYSVPACPQTVGVPVAANSSTTIGTAGDVGSGQSWSWDGSGAVVGSGPVTVPASDYNWTLTNPQAMTGGKDASTQSVFSTSDASAAQQKLQGIDSKLTSKADAQLKRLAGKSVLAQTAGGKGILVTVTNPTMPTGCNTSASTPCPAASAETLSVALSAAATAYSPAAARSALLADLKSKIPHRSELLAHPKLGTPRVVSAGAGGTVTLSARAIGYWAPMLDLAPLQSKLAFRSPSSARSYLLARLPAKSTVTISQFPFGWPWLPVLSSHIHLVRESLSQGRSTE